MYTFVNKELLNDRVQYISSLNTFYKDKKKQEKEISIDFPCQKYMSIQQCSNIFQALSTPCCIIALSRIDIQAVLFFACYFQSSYIFEHVLDIIRIDLMKLPHAIKTVITLLGYRDECSGEMLQFACDHLNTYFKQDIIEMMKPKGEEYLDVNPTEYVTSRLGKKIRDMERKKKYIFSSTYNMCMMCETLVVCRKNDVDVVHMPCCNKPAHIRCFSHFIQKSKVRGIKRCVYCNMDWCHGLLQCGKEYLKWCTERYSGI